MKVGMFSPYLDTMGGGERYFLTAAEFFLKRGDKVDIFWSGDRNPEKIKIRFSLNLIGANFKNDIFFTPGSRLRKFLITAQYDLLFFLSDGSIPLSFAPKTIIHFQVPFTNAPNNLLTKLKLSRSIAVCNSLFTKKYIDQTFGIDSKVIYPPVDIGNFKPGKKENIILAVGRFFAPSHPKKQEILIETFKKISPKIPKWSLVLIGGATLGTKINDLKNKSRGCPIKIITDASVNELKNYYGRAKLFWHAAGYGEDLETQPDRAEHFGITAVEAMAAGCVPVVFSGGGQREIVEKEKTGCLWNNLEELEIDTLGLINNRGILNKMSKKAVLRARDFSKEKFFAAMEQIV